MPIADNGQIKAYAPDLKEDWVYNRSDKADTKAESTPESTAQTEEGK